MAQNIISIDGGSKQYWADLKAAYTLILKVTHLHAAARNAPMYTGHYISDDGDMDIEENLGPWEYYDGAIKTLRINPVAMRILAAQGKDLNDL